MGQIISLFFTLKIGSQSNQLRLIWDTRAGLYDSELPIPFTRGDHGNCWVLPVPRVLPISLLHAPWYLRPSINFSPKYVLVCPELSEASAANFIFLLFHFRTKLSVPLLKTDYSAHHSLTRFQRMVFSGKHQDLLCKELFSVSSWEPFLMLLEGAETVSLRSCFSVAQTSKRETLSLLQVSSVSLGNSCYRNFLLANSTFEVNCRDESLAVLLTAGSLWVLCAYHFWVDGLWTQCLAQVWELSITRNREHLCQLLEY